MLIIEALAVLTAFLVLVRLPRAVFGSRRGAFAATGALALLLLIVLIVDPFRWQLVPIVAFGVLALIAGALRLRRKEIPERRKLWRGAGIVGAALLALLVLLPAAAFPLFEIPRPTGPRAVGTMTLALKDPARADPFAKDPAARREFVVRAWYPSSSAGGGETAPYLSKRTVDALVGGQLPVFLLRHLSLIETDSHPGIPPSAGRHPVLVFIPGFRAFVTQSTALMQELASRGYVVLSLGAPGDASAVEFPDGRVVTFKREELLNDRAGTDAMAAGMSEQNPARHEALVRKVLAGMPNADRAVRLQAADVRYLLDRIEQGGLGSLDGKLDPNRIGVFGMSLGGAVAGQVCLNDKRCRVGANLDGFQFGDLHHRSIGVPFMMISSDYSRGPLLNDRMYRAPGQPSTVLDLQVAGARHLDFTDFTLSVPLIKRLLPNPAIGSVNGGRMVRLLNALTLGFFDEHLLGKEGAVKAAMRGRPELRVRSVPGSAVQPVPGTQVAP